MLRWVIGTRHKLRSLQLAPNTGSSQGLCHGPGQRSFYGNRQFRIEDPIVIREVGARPAELTIRCEVAANAEY